MPVVIESIDTLEKTPDPSYLELTKPILDASEVEFGDGKVEVQTPPVPVPAPAPEVAPAPEGAPATYTVASFDEVVAVVRS